MLCSLQVNGELPRVVFRLSDQCLIGLIDLVRSVQLPTGPQVTMDELQQFRVSQFVIK